MPYATYRFNKIIATETIRFIVTVAIVVYKGLKLVVYRMLTIIREAENYSRGFYTGVMGYFDGKDLDSAVMIRFLEQEAGGKLVFKSGGGITFLSDVRDEYEEMKRKVYVPIY